MLFLLFLTSLVLEHSDFYLVANSVEYICVATETVESFGGKLQDIVGTRAFFSFLSLRLFSFPVLPLFSGQGGNDSAKKKKSVVMERVVDCSGGEDKSTPVLSYLAVLNTSTIH